MKVIEEGISILFYIFFVVVGAIALVMLVIGEENVVNILSSLGVPIK